MSKVDTLIAAGMRELGRPYVLDAAGPNAFDCSGLMLFLFGQVGISLPRTAADQQAATQTVANPMPGDLVFWGNPAYHVALYLGNGKILTAPHTGDVVKIEPLWGKPSKFGRVPGLGTALAPVVDTVSNVIPVLNNPATGFTSSVTSLVEYGIFVLGGAGMVGWGVYLVATGGRGRPRKEPA